MGSVFLCILFYFICIFTYILLTCTLNWWFLCFIHKELQFGVSQPSVNNLLLMSCIPFYPFIITIFFFLFPSILQRLGIHLSHDIIKNIFCRFFFNLLWGGGKEKLFHPYSLGSFFSRCCLFREEEGR